MKGLLKNNLFEVYSNIRMFSVFMLVLGVFATAVISRSLLIGYAMLSIVGFSIISVTGIKRESASKWEKYKLTMPVNRASIVKSYFISQLIWMAVGVAFSGVSIGLSWGLHGCPFDNYADTLSVFAVGISASLFTGAFFFPLFHLGGGERSEVSLVISLLCGIGLILGIVSAVNFCLAPGLITILAGDAILIICALFLFALSYPLTVHIYRGKDY